MQRHCDALSGALHPKQKSDWLTFFMYGMTGKNIYTPLYNGGHTQ
jgi:hypothetical protein